MNTNHKSELLKKAHDKISNMSIQQLENFLGIIYIKKQIIEPLENYSINEIVEITTFIPSIGYEFIGKEATIKEFRNEFVLVEFIQSNGKPDLRTTTKEHIRKLNRIRR